MLAKSKIKNFLYPLYFEIDADLVYLVHSPNPSVKIFFMLTPKQFSIRRKSFLYLPNPEKSPPCLSTKTPKFPNENNFLQLT